MATNKPMKVEATTRPLVPWETTFGFPLFNRLSRDFDAMFNRLGLERPFEQTARVWLPEMEMFTKDNQLHVKIDVPGMKKDEITVEVTDEYLVVRGERKSEKEEKKEGFFKTERTYGSFYRTIPLPDGVKTEPATAAMHDGVLEITFPMAKVEEKTRKLEISEPAPASTSKAA